MTIDIAFFPHIFDLVFEFADARALARLRCTCRALRDKVDSEWGHVEWSVPYGRAVEVRNRSGFHIPQDSEYLHFTSTLDMHIAPEFCGPSPAGIPVHLDPEVIRFLHRHEDDLITTDTVVFYNSEADLMVDPMASKDRHMRLIYRFECERLTGRPYDFENIGVCSGTADVFIEVSGGDPIADPDPYSAGGCVRELCHDIVRTLIDQGSDVYVQFYFVDTPSWFAASDRRPPRGSVRLDHVFSRPDTFYGYLLSCAESWLEVEENSKTWWPSPQEVKYLTQIHCITKEEMRQHIGDKAYDLTYAPVDRNARG